MIVSPSVLSADFSNLAASLDAVSDADWLHIDVMDGHFVPNLSFGVPVLKCVRKLSKKPLDVHIMVTNPYETAGLYLEAGADILTFHAECCYHPLRVIDLIHEAGAQAGIALNPSTPVEALRDVISAVDLVLVMSVNPGFSGQAFIENTYEKLDRLHDLCEATGAHPIIEVDGGVDENRAAKLAAHGTEAFVSGSYIFDSPNPAVAIDTLRKACRS